MPETPDLTERARAEAEREFPVLAANDEPLTYPREALREFARGGYVRGYLAGWAAQQSAAADRVVEWGVHYDRDTTPRYFPMPSESHARALADDAFAEFPPSLVHRDVTRGPWLEVTR